MYVLLDAGILLEGAPARRQEGAQGEVQTHHQGEEGGIGEKRGLQVSAALRRTSPVAPRGLPCRRRGIFLSAPGIPRILPLIGAAVYTTAHAHPALHAHPHAVHLSQPLY